MKRWSLFWTLVGVGFLGCAGPHYTLPRALPRSQPFPQRLAMYRTYQPTILHSTTITTYGSFGPASSTNYDFLLLSTGQTIQHPEDLLPLAGDGTPTVDAVRRMNAQSSGGGWTSLAGGVLGTLGGILSIAELSRNLPLSERQQDFTGFWVGVGAQLIGVVALVVGGVIRASAGSSRRDAFMSFDGSLRHTLGICGESDAPYDCALGPRAPAASASPWRSAPGTPALPPPPPSPSAVVVQ